MTTVFIRVDRARTITRDWTAIGLSGECWEVTVGDCMKTAPGSRTAEVNLARALERLTKIDPSV